VCLLVLYLLQVVSAFLPTRLLEPGWQLGVANAFINNGFLALLGLSLVHLAAYLAPSNPRLARRRDDFASWALIAVLGFLLLIPLQGYALWRVISNVNAQQQNRLGTVSGRLSTLRQAISTAPTTQELQRRLAALKAPPLNAADLAQPLPKLRKSMLDSVDRTEIRARDQLKGLPATDVWQLAQAGVRSVLSALVLVIGFASFSRRRGWESTLLQRWLGRFQQRRRPFSHAPSKRTHRAGRERAEDFLRSLAVEERPKTPPAP
jgi:hypothetical protein